MSPWLVWLLSGAMLVLGFLGSWLPGLPGLPLMAGGALLLKMCLPGALSWWTVGIFLLVAALGFVLDFLITLYASQKAGATRAGTLGAILGGMVGLVFALPGLLIGPFLGAFLGETLVSRRSASEGFRAGVGAGLGFLAGTIGKGLLAIGLGVFFLVDAFLIR